MTWAEDNWVEDAGRGSCRWFDWDDLLPDAAELARDWHGRPPTPTWDELGRMHPDQRSWWTTPSSGAGGWAA